MATTQRAVTPTPAHKAEVTRAKHAITFLKDDHAAVKKLFTTHQ